MTPRKILNALITSYFYNRDTEDVLKMLDELQMRIKNYYCVWTDDVNIIFGTLILLYGDYGTSPRGGWFDDQKAKEEILDEIKRIIKEYEETLEREKEEQEPEPTRSYDPNKAKVIQSLMSAIKGGK